MIASNNNYHSILRSSFWCRINQFLVLVAMYNMEVRNVWVLTSGYTFILILWYIGTILLILGICVVLVTKKGLPVYAHGWWFSPGTMASSANKNLSPWYNWNIAESGVNTPNINQSKSYFGDLCCF
jgi:hypothetical protein